MSISVYKHFHKLRNFILFLNYLLILIILDHIILMNLLLLNLMILVLPKLIIRISHDLILWWNQYLIIIFKHVSLIIRVINLDISRSLINHLILYILIFLRLYTKILVMKRLNLVYNIYVLILILLFLHLIFTFEDLIKRHFWFKAMNLRSLLRHSINWMSLLNFILNK